MKTRYMKKRINFVSNNSSSSFIVSTTIDIHNKILEEVSSKTRLWFQNHAEYLWFVGNVVIIFARFSSEDQYIEICDFTTGLPTLCENYEIIEQEIYGYFDEYCKALAKHDENFQREYDL